MKKLGIVYIFVVFMFSGCVYYPQMVEIPLIAEKNDIRIDAGVTFPAASANATVSYGLTDKMSIQGFGSYGADEKYYFQLAPGWYRKNTKNRVMELYGGIGIGHGYAHDLDMGGTLRGNYQLYFTQFNYGKVASNTSNFEYGFAVKTGILRSHFQNYHYWRDSGYGLLYHDSSFLLEPTGMMRFGWERFRFSFKVGATWLYKITRNDYAIPHGPFNIGLGINYRLCK